MAARTPPAQLLAERKENGYDSATIDISGHDFCSYLTDYETGNG